MANQSAGILLYRKAGNDLEFFLVHPGGSFWQKKDIGVWTIPKGEFADDEEPLVAAQREFKEETGTAITGKFLPLTPVKQKAGKLILAWGVEGNIDPSTIKSNQFTMEWPPKSGKWKEFPEIDRAEWFTSEEAKQRINPAQVLLIEELHKILG